MSLKLVEEPQYFLNPDMKGVTERLVLSNESEAPIFQIGDNKASFKNFELEVSKKEIDSSEIENINVFIPNIENEQIIEISKFFNMTDEQINEVKNIKKATLAFSIEPDIIEKYIQPMYDSPEKSRNLFKVVDENNNIVLLDFQNYLVQGLQEETD